MSIQTAQTIQNQIISILKKNVAKSPSIPRREHPNEKSVAKTYSPATGATSGNNDIFSMTQPQIIKNIYMEYLEVGGSDMIGTNTFSSTTIAIADYEMEAYAYELNYIGAKLAREACDEVTAKDPTRPRFVVGAMGPTNRTGSISPSVSNSKVGYV